MGQSEYQRQKAAEKDLGLQAYMEELAQGVEFDLLGGDVPGGIKNLGSYHYPQETAWWCGPASAKSVLAVRGINVSQSAAASWMGTTSSSGTASGTLAAYLTNQVKAQGGSYSFQFVADAMPTTDVYQTFRYRISKNINEGWASVANVAIVNNAYSFYGYPDVNKLDGHAIHHYVAIDGYTGKGANFAYTDPAHSAAIADKDVWGVWVPQRGEIDAYKLAVMVGGHGYIW